MTTNTMWTSPSSALIKSPVDTGKHKESGIERGWTQGERDGKFKAYGKNNVEKGYWREAQTMPRYKW